MTTTIDGSAGVTTPSGAVINPAFGTVNAGGTNPFPASGGPTSVTFTSIPSWVKRITVIFNNVSQNNAGNALVQLGSGSILTTGYTSISAIADTGGSFNGSSNTSGFVIFFSTGANAFTGHMIITPLSGNLWVSSHTGLISTTAVSVGSGGVTLGGSLDRIRITSDVVTNIYDAGSINILYE